MLAATLVARQRITARALALSAVPGVIFGLNLILFFSSIKLTTVANATLLSNITPIFILAVAAPMFGETVGRREVLWTVASLIGMAVLVFGSSGIPEWSVAGDALAFAAMLLWTIYFLITKRLRIRVGTLEYFTGVLAAAAITLVPLALLTGDVEAPSRGDWPLLALLVLLGNGGHILTTWAHRYVDVSRSAVITLAIPVISALGALWILGESFAPMQILGGIVVLVGVGFAARRTAEITDVEAEAPG